MLVSLGIERFIQGILDCWHHLRSRADCRLTYFSLLSRSSICIASRLWAILIVPDRLTSAVVDCSVEWIASVKFSNLSVETPLM